MYYILHIFQMSFSDNYNTHILQDECGDIITPETVLNLLVGMGRDF